MTHTSSSSCGAGDAVLDESELESRGKMHIRVHKSIRPRQMHEVSLGQLNRVTNSAVGLLPQCYWCETLQRQLEAIRARTIGCQEDVAPPGGISPNRLTYERARLAIEHLDMGGKVRQAYWREAEGHWKRIKEMPWEAGATSVVAALQETDAVETWRRRQASAWSSQRPKAAAQQEQWLMEAARGDHCRHCVDPLPPACPSCGACEMDADPGESGGGACGVCEQRCSRRFVVLPVPLPGAVTNNTRLAASARLVGMHHSEKVAVFRRACLACGHSVSYDGLEAGVCNYSNQTLFCEEVPRAYWNAFFDQKLLTLHSFYKQVRRNYEFVERHETPFPTRSLFTYVVGVCVCYWCVGHENPGVTKPLFLVAGTRSSPS